MQRCNYAFTLNPFLLKQEKDCYILYRKIDKSYYFLIINFTPFKFDKKRDYVLRLYYKERKELIGGNKMRKLFKSGLLSFLACTVLMQSVVVGYSTEIKKYSNTFDNTYTSFYSDNNSSKSLSAEVTEDDINAPDTEKDYTDGLEILESAEVSDDYAKENDPLYKKYMESSANKIQPLSFGVTEPKTPAALEGLNVVDGIDVSMYQAYSTPIDWNKVKDAGISYAIIRCGYRGWGTGEIVADSYFQQNIEGALAAGLQVGVYFYTQAITATEARQEADFCKNAVKGYNITLPIYIDIEFADSKGRLDSKGLSKASKTNICKAFANRVQSAGYTGGVYANKSWLETEIDGTALADKFAIWLAHYTNNTTYAGEFSMWQYSSKGSISGIKGSVDINKYYFSKPHKVTGLTANDSLNNDPTEFYLSWTCAAGAYKYQAKVYDESTATWVSLGTTKSNTMTITGLDTSKEKQYKVRAFKLIGTEKIYGPYSSVVTYSAPLSKATGFTQTAATTASVSLKWNKVPDAVGYYLHKYNESNQQWEQIQTLPGNENVTAKITGLDYSTVYKFRVQGYAVEEDGTITPLVNSATLNTATSPKKVSGLKFSKLGAKTIKLTWKALDRASGYQVLCYNSSKKEYEVCATVSGQNKNIAAIKNLKPGTTYKFKVQAYKTANQTKWAGSRTTVYSISTLPAKVTKLRYSFSGNKCTLTWKACTGASGYQVQKYNKTTKKWKAVKTIKGKSSTKYKFNLAKNSSAKYRVRAYKTIKSKKRYGAFSANKNVKH